MASARWCVRRGAAVPSARRAGELVRARDPDGISLVPPFHNELEGERPEGAERARRRDPESLAPISPLEPKIRARLAVVGLWGTRAILAVELARSARGAEPGRLP